MTTEEIKQQAHKEFKINNEALLLEYISRAYPSGNISKLYLEVKDSLIDKTVQSERERIVGVINGMQNAEDIKFGRLANGEILRMNPAGVGGYNQARYDIISLITNKSDINK